MTTVAPAPTVADVLKRKTTRTATGALLTARNRGLRWVNLDIDRISVTHGPSAWPASTAATMKALADKLSSLFVYSHSSGCCSVSSFDRETGYLLAPRRCGDVFLTALLDAEHGDDQPALALLKV